MHIDALNLPALNNTKYEIAGRTLKIATSSMIDVSHVLLSSQYASKIINAYCAKSPLFRISPEAQLCS